MEIERLRERQAQLVDNSREIMDRADEQGRDLTSAELSQVKEIRDQFRALSERIEAESEFGEHEAAMSRPQGRRVEPEPLGRDVYEGTYRSAPRRASGGSDGRGDDRRVLADFREVLRGKKPLGAMKVGSDPDGGSFVPEQIDRRVLDQLVDISPVRQVAEVVSTATSDYVKLVNKRGTASNWGGEETTRTETATPDIAEIRPPHGELWAYPWVTTWLLEDSAFSVEGFINENVATEFAFQEGGAFVNGTGVNQPRGFLTYSTAATADDSRDFGTLEHLAAASATDIAPDELIQLVYKLKPAYRQGPNVAWMMNSTTASEIRQLKDSQNRYLWTDGLQPGQPPMLLGYPVIEAEDLPNTATGNLPVAFGNWRRAYIITDRIGTRMIRDEVTKPGWIKFSFGKRVGGAVTDSNAIKFIKMA